MQGAGAALDDAVVVQHGDDGAKEAFHVHAETQMLHIVAVELGLLVDLQLIAAVNLCPAGQAGADIVGSVFVALGQQGR